MKGDFLYIVLFGFGSGIFFRSFFNFGFSFSFLFVLLGISLILLYFFYLKSRENFNLFNLNKFFIGGLFLFFAGLGMLRFDFVGLDKSDLYFENFIDEKIKAKVLIVEEPSVKEFNTQLIAEFISLENFSLPENIEKEKKIKQEKIILTVKHYPRFKYGDEIEIFGKLQKPKNFNSDDSREFDYVSYLAKDKIYYQMFYPDTVFLSGGKGNFIKEKLFAIKNAFISQIKKSIPEPHASLLGGLVVGAKESLGKKLQNDFRKVGLIHIVVLSGYNLTIVAEFMIAIFSFLPGLIPIF